MPEPENSVPTGSVTRLASLTIKALAPQFLALIVLNLIFFVVLFWFVDTRANHTVAVIDQLLKSCLEK